MTGFNHQGYAEAIKPYNDAVTAAGVTMTVQSGAPWSESTHDMTGWTVTLTFKGRTMTTPYYMGKGHDGNEPTIAEVLHSLFVDASCAYDTLDDYVGEFLSLDEQTHEAIADARRTWKAYIASAKKTRRLLGQDFDAIGELVADL